MGIILGVVLFFILTFSFIGSYRRTNDIVSPLCVYSILQMVRYVPKMIMTESTSLIDINDTSIVITFAVETVAVLCTMFGYYSKDNSHVELKETTYKMKVTQAAVIAISIGFLMQVFFLFRVGGISQILSNTKGNYGNGNGYINALGCLSVVGACLLIAQNKKGFIPLIILGIVSYIFPKLIQLKRSPILECFLTIAFTYHYCVKRFSVKSLFRVRTIIIVGLVILFIITVPQIRNSGRVANVVDYIEVSRRSNILDSFFKEMSYVARDSFVYTNYDYTNYYYGRTFLNLLYAPIPRRLYAAKPPVDDGLYLYNYMKGVYVLPPSNEYVHYNSCPFSTQGSLFANFGIIGVIIGCFLMGKVYRKAYRYLNSNPKDPFVCLFYFCIVYQLELSSLSITQAAIPIVIAFLFLRYLAGRRVSKTGVPLAAEI